MTKSRLATVCLVTVLITVKVWRTNSTTYCTVCNAPLPRLQTIVAHPGREIRYRPESNGNVLSPRWCINGIPATNVIYHSSIRIEGDELIYSNPSTNNEIDLGTLYLANDTCSNVASATFIYSDVGDITARLILLHVVEVIPCLELSHPLNGQVTVSERNNSHPLIQTATYSCNPGYHLSGNNGRQCVRGVDEQFGQWTGVEPTCISVTCEEKTLANGTVSYCGDNESLINGVVTYGTTISYQCDPGFYLSGGNETQTCLSGDSDNGRWSGITPVCKAMTCALLRNISNGVITYWDENSRVFETQSNYVIGTVARHTCLIGFKPSSSEDRVCMSSGEWSSERIQCITIECPHLETPLNGTIVFSSDSNTVGQTATYSCEEGYTLDRGSMQRTCFLVTNNTAVWDGDPPVCTSMPTTTMTITFDVANVAGQNTTQLPCSEEVIKIALPVAVGLGALMLLTVLASIICIFKSHCAHEKEVSVDDIVFTQSHDKVGNHYDLQSTPNT